MRLMPMKRTDRLGATSPGTPGWNRPIDALLLLARAQQQDVGLARFVDVELVARHQRQAAPGDEGRAEQRHGWRRHAAAGAFAPEGRDGARMREEEGRLLPDLRDEFVEIVGRRRAGARVLIFIDGCALARKPYSALLMSSLSCLSFTFSVSRRTCS